MVCFNKPCFSHGDQKRVSSRPWNVTNCPGSYDLPGIYLHMDEWSFSLYTWNSQYSRKFSLLVARLLLSSGFEMASTMNALTNKGNGLISVASIILLRLYNPRDGTGSNELGWVSICSWINRSNRYPLTFVWAPFRLLMPSDHCVPKYSCGIWLCR